MITTERVPISQEKQDQLKAWLTSKESFLIEECLKAEIAELQVEGANHSVGSAKEASSLLVSGTVSNETMEKFGQAVPLLMFMETLKTLRGRTSFETLKIGVE